MDNRLIKQIRAPLLLKDHLLDDMSSYSSNGFKSFPRRQCCTTVRFLDAKIKLQRQQKAYVSFKKPPSKSALSALQSVITAVKRLQLGAAKLPEKKRSNINSFLPRSFSRRLFKRGSFWRRKPEQKEIERWKSFDQLRKEDSQPPSDRFNGSIAMTDDSKSYSSCFTASEGGNSSSEVNSNLPQQKNYVVRMSDHGVGVKKRSRFNYLQRRKLRYQLFHTNKGWMRT